MPPSGWPAPGTPAAAKALCERHLVEWKASDRTRLEIGGGVAAILLGINILIDARQDYDTCASISGNTDSRCETAHLFYWGGIALLLVGVALIAGALIAAKRR